MKTCGNAVVEITDGTGHSTKHVLRGGSYVVGSSAQCDLPISVSGVSRRHLQLEVLPDGGVLIADLGSSNGTRYGKRKIERMAVLEPSSFRFGEARLTVYPDSDEARVVGLPELDLTTRPTTGRTAQSAATDLPNKGWALILAFADSLDEIASSKTAVSVMAGVLGRWSALLGNPPMRLRSAQAPHAIVAAAGDLSTLDCENRSVLAGAELVLEIDHRQPTELSANLLLALRVGISAMSRHSATPPETASAEPAQTPLSTPGMLSASAQMHRLYEMASRVASGTVPVLVRGESGVGKELLARWIHQQSPRRDGPFLAINCAALPAELLEAEVFGIERGVATGVDARAGLLERARGGTVFLDELGDMANSTQAKILRALESETLYRVGGSKALAMDVRFVAATHRSLDQLIAEGCFRLDLYHRIAAVELLIPALRQRREDIALLATRFLAEELARYQRPSPGITDAALATLCQHDWHGNVRELRNEMARAALLLNAHQPLCLEQLSERVRECAGVNPDLSLEGALANAEQQAFAIALTAARNDHASAMNLLQLSRSSYFRRLRSLRGETPGEQGDDYRHD